MELHQIRYFLAVEREQNFTRAAQLCNITQPALTRAIQKLEAETGGKLFHRRNGRAELTELGRAMLPRLEAVVRDVSNAREEALAFIRQRKQRLRLGIMCTVGPDRLIGLISQLSSQVPSLTIELTEAKGSAVVAALLNDEIDVGLVGMPAYPDACEISALYSERYMLALPAAHRFAMANSVRLRDLDGENYVERLNCEFDDYFQANHGEWPIHLNVRYQSTREDWIQAMICAGLGFAILPETFPLLPGIARTHLVEPEVCRTISIATLRDRENSPVARAFVQIVRAHDWC